MNPGDKVRVTKRGTYFGKEGVFDSWANLPYSQQPYCLVKFEDWEVGFDPWDLELVEAEPRPTTPTTCDKTWTTGRQFEQEHSCTYPLGHSQFACYCSVCGSYSNDGNVTNARR